MISCPICKSDEQLWVGSCCHVVCGTCRGAGDYCRLCFGLSTWAMVDTLRPEQRKLFLPLSVGAKTATREIETVTAAAIKTLESSAQVGDEPVPPPHRPRASDCSLRGSRRLHSAQMGLNRFPRVLPR